MFSLIIYKTQLIFQIELFSSRKSLFLCSPFLTMSLPQLHKNMQSKSFAIRSASTLAPPPNFPPIREANWLSWESSPQRGDQSRPTTSRTTFSYLNCLGLEPGGRLGGFVRPAALWLAGCRLSSLKEITESLSSSPRMSCSDSSNPCDSQWPVRL